MARDNETRTHRAWLGYLQPVGLVVSPPALVKAQVVPGNVIELQQTLRGLVTPAADVADAADATDARFLDSGSCIRDLPRFFEKILGWNLAYLAGGPADAGCPPLPEHIELVLPDYGETLRPTYAVPDPDFGPDFGPDPDSGPGAPDAARWLMLVSEWPAGTDLDQPAAAGDRAWHASPQARLERLLRETGIPAGLLINGTALRLVYAPQGESSGHVTFPVAAMVEVAGRDILAAMHMLLDEYRVFSAPAGRRLTDLLAESRKYQNEVSTRLAEQVLGALWELLRGFQAADEAAAGRLLGDFTDHDPEHVYGGLLTTLLRMVFLLYAEDQGLMPQGEVYARNYSIAGLYERLRQDAGTYPDTMDQRYGAWACLLSLFRMVHDGGACAGFELPTRHGQLFDPDAYAFLENRSLHDRRVENLPIEPPRVSDGCIVRVLQGLLVLGGERLSYRALDVEQIGSVYEAMMGFAVERAAGRSIAVKSDAHKPGAVRADPVIDVDALLLQKPSERVRWLISQATCKLTGKAAGALEAAATADDVVAALGRKVSERTPRLMAPGSLYLQPGEERRRSGSHYTPRELTGPIVRTTLRPVLQALGERPRPEKILELRVCDPAMGSGAFLVEACRQLAEKLVEAWNVHDCMPAMPADEEPLLYARRLVAQTCLYGVDRNRFAVNLARLSLWLVTLARDHAFTFLDHALKHGDSLVGLSREQIGAFHWHAEELDHGPLFENVRAAVGTARAWRDELRALDDDDDAGKRARFREAEDAVHQARVAGDLVIAAFFAGGKGKERDDRRREYAALLDAWRAGQSDGVEIRERVEALRGGERGVVPFHWDVEFPEVFDRELSGFDAIVGNPPFAGKNTIIDGNVSGYLDWLKLVHAESHGNADLVAHFYRRAFSLLRERGTFGLIATNTIAQGDTRGTGLRWICMNGGHIYAASKRYKWPGIAAVVVSVVHVMRGAYEGVRELDGREVERITAFLFHAGGHENPVTLRANADRSFQGSIVLGMGFTFDDTDKKGVASPIAEMHRLIEKDPRNAERIFPYIGGEEINTSPSHAHHRYVINFGEMSEGEARQWPDVMAIVEAKVKRQRLGDKREIYRRLWWQYAEKRVGLYDAIQEMERVIAISLVSTRYSLTFLRTGQVFSHKLGIFAFGDCGPFAILQSQVHETWARFLSSSMKDDLNYSPSDCFETFPFPEGWEDSVALEQAGKAYYEFRAELMVKNNQGLTDTYNRFHDQDERDADILKLRELHAAMDRAVLHAYGWADISTDCDYLLDYDIDEETWGSKKKPYRYRWPETVHDEVLARLLDLNQQRAAEERRASLAATPAAKPRKKPSRKKAAGKRKPAAAEQTALSFDATDKPSD
jgi:hypothetical protein